MKIGSIVFISMISEYLVYCKCGAERVEMNQFYRLGLFIPSFIVGNFRTVYNAWREINEQKSAWFVRVCLCVDQVYKWLLKISLGFRRSHKFIPKKNSSLFIFPHWTLSKFNFYSNARCVCVVQFILDFAFKISFVVISYAYPLNERQAEHFGMNDDYYINISLKQ